MGLLRMCSVVYNVHNLSHILRFNKIWKLSCESFSFVKKTYLKLIAKYVIFSVIFCESVF